MNKPSRSPLSEIQLFMLEEILADLDVYMFQQRGMHRLDPETGASEDDIGLTDLEPPTMREAG